MLSPRRLAHLAIAVAATVLAGCATSEFPTDLNGEPITIELPEDVAFDAEDAQDTRIADIDDIDDIEDIEDIEDDGYTLIPDALGPPDIVNPPKTCPLTACIIGTRDCLSPGLTRECIADDENCGQWTTAAPCPTGGICENNTCRTCVDLDGDGYGDGCLLGPDCDDTDDAVYPGAPERCNGKDNNCDGTTDTGFNVGESCASGHGECRREGQFVCRDDGVSTICGAVAGQPTAELCDGKDNDCDGTVDNGFDIGAACQAGLGECRRDGQLICRADGTGTICDAVPAQPGAETCNGRDDNCDGTIDTGFNVGQACFAGIGECRREGVLFCLADGTGTACSAIPAPPSPEICDGKDNNCNGIIDSGGICNPTCVDDLNEPNNTSLTGTPLAVGESLEMTLCPDDGVDWFRLGNYSEGDTVFIEAIFDQVEGDLDMEMFVGAAYETFSNSDTSNESITRTLSRSGNVAVRIYYKTSHTPRVVGTPYIIRR